MAVKAYISSETETDAMTFLGEKFGDPGHKTIFFISNIIFS